MFTDKSFDASSGTEICADPEIKPFVPSEKTGSVSFVSKVLKPKKIITISEIMLIETIKS